MDSESKKEMYLFLRAMIWDTKKFWESDLGKREGEMQQGRACPRLCAARGVNRLCRRAREFAPAAP